MVEQILIFLGMILQIQVAIQIRLVMPKVNAIIELNAHLKLIMICLDPCYRTYKYLGIYLLKFYSL